MSKLKVFGSHPHGTTHTDTLHKLIAQTKREIAIYLEIPFEQISKECATMFIDKETQ